MEEIVAKILVWVFPVIRSQLDYLIHYESKLENLETQKRMLEEARERLKRNVDTAKRNVMEIEADIMSRLTKYDDIIAVAREILEDDERSATMAYCNGCCPNWMSRYQLSKKADKAASEAMNLKDEMYKIISVGHREPIRLVGAVKLNRGYADFESRAPTITGVLNALKDPDINRIGVHGMGGVGKTMLVKEVVNQAEKHNLFNNYVFVAVSKEPDLMDIQTKIANQLGLELGKADEFGRPDLLSKRLQQGKILLVIDDIWKPLMLDDVGYTFEADQKDCKLLLTSRFDKVCKDMYTQKQFPVGILSENEARNLFENIIGHPARIPEIQHTMLQIVEECSGLPVAITTVANALKNEEDIHVWKNALVRFKISNPKKIDGMNEKVYKSIKWSYEFLKDNEAKSLWLLCSLHGEDYDIKVEDLIRFCVGWNLFRDLDNIENVRCRVRTLVKELKDCSLLLDGDDSGTVKMHDIIRDVAIDIAADERHMFTIRSSAELQKRSKSKNSTVISLPYINNGLELSNQFECSKLELLLLFDQEDDFRIPDSFFEGLKDLKVLKLSESWSGVLPSSLSSLENLQTLCLDGEVQNAIIIGELKNLKVLSLSLSNTEWLPKEIGQLTHLQLLDLRGCSELKFIPPNVLSNLKRLEELYLPDQVEWEVEAQSTERINAMVSELDHLSQLTKLHICIENAKILPKAMIFKGLESYRIAIGSRTGMGDETLEISRILSLNISFQSDYGYKELFRKCEALVLKEMKGVKNNLYELDSEGFQSLKQLVVQKNDEIQYIIKSMGVLNSVFPSLESISLWDMNNLKGICYTRLPPKTFCNLRSVTVGKCCKLEFVFSSFMVGCFPHLQEMKIEDCKIMSAIVAIEREEEIEVNSDDNIMFANLQYLRLRVLLKLKGFLSVVDSLVLFKEKVVFPSLEELEIEGIDSIKMIWPNQLISDFFGKLETLAVLGCKNLTNIVPPNMLRMLPNLKNLRIENCGSIEEVFEVQGKNNVEESRDIATAELKSLTLIRLKKVKHVWSMHPQGITFAKLCTVEIYSCSSLKSIFPTSVVKALMQLGCLTIENCEMVEEIVAKEEGIETITLFVFPKLTTLKLYNLPELKSLYPERHTSEWPSLHSVDIHKCNKLKIVGSNKSSMQETNGLDHYASLIQPLFFIEKDKFPNLEVLIFDDAMNETCDGLLGEFCCNLKELILSGNGESPRAGVSDFHRLKNIVLFSSTSFHYLQTLVVSRHDVLISLLTPSTARTLVQLKTISICDCERMTEIVANEGSEAEARDEIAFNNLTSFEMSNLPSLTAFHLGNRTIKFPSLSLLYVDYCPKLKIFYSGVLSTPNLYSFRIEGKHIIKEEGDLDVNATIKEYWEAKLETCDQKFAEKTDASEVRESEHDAIDNLERDTTGEVGDTT